MATSAWFPCVLSSSRTCCRVSGGRRASCTVLQCGFRPRSAESGKGWLLVSFRFGNFRGPSASPDSLGHLRTSTSLEFLLLLSNCHLSLHNNDKPITTKGSQRRLWSPLIFTTTRCPCWLQRTELTIPFQSWNGLLALRTSNTTQLAHKHASKNESAHLFP